MVEGLRDSQTRLIGVLEYPKIECFSGKMPRGSFLASTPIIFIVLHVSILY